MEIENRWYRVTEKYPPLTKYASDRPEQWSGYIWCKLDHFDAELENFRNPRPDLDRGWWVLYPDWMWEHRERTKERWVIVHAGHPFGDLRGFYFLDKPGRIGQKFTYDPATGEWDR